MEKALWYLFVASRGGANRVRIVRELSSRPRNANELTEELDVDYREFGSTLLLGLVGFSAVLLVENLISIAFFFNSMRTLYAMDPLVGRVVIGMRLLELLAVSLLTYATLK